MTMTDTLPRAERDLDRLEQGIADYEAARDLDSLSPAYKRGLMDTVNHRAFVAMQVICAETEGTGEPFASLNRRFNSLALRYSDAKETHLIRGDN